MIENTEKHPKTTAKQKLLLILFGFSLLAFVEITLRIVDYGSLLRREDPFIGFEKIYPLFGKKQLSSGESVYATNSNKQNFFNLQQFRPQKGVNSFRIFCFGGSTTYGRPYQAPSAFPKWLAINLNGMDPLRPYEVINAGGISYASYRIVNLVEEMFQYEPDLFVILTGHNEFLETLTYAEILEENPIVRNVKTTLDELRTYALLRQMIGYFSSQKEALERKFLLKSEVDAVLDRVGGYELYERNEQQRRSILQHYRFNLEKMIQMGKAKGVAVILLKPVSNIRNFSPFKSLHSDYLNYKDETRWQILYNQGMNLYEKEAYAEALAAFQDALALDSVYAELHFRIGQCYDALGQYEEAKRHYILAKNLDICPLRALSQMGVILEDVAKRYKVPLIDLVPIFEAKSEHGIIGNEWLIDHVHPKIEGHQLIAEEICKVLLQQGLINQTATWSQEERLEAYDSLLRSLDSEYFALGNLNLGKVLTWARKHREAIPPLEEAAKNLPHNKEVHKLLGNSYSYVGEFEKAIRAYKKVLKIDFNDPNVHDNLGNAYIKLGMINRAINEFQTAIGVDSTYIQAYNNLGNVYMQKEWVERAIHTFQTALGIDSTYAQAYNNLGRAYIKRGLIDQAIDAFQTAVRLDSSDVFAYNNLAVAHIYAGKYDKAIEAYQNTARLTPYDPQAFNNLGITYLRQGLTQPAIDAFQAAIHLDACFTQAYVNMGNAYGFMEEFKRAIFNYQKAIELSSPTNTKLIAESYANLGNIYARTGVLDEAIAAWEKAVKLQPGLSGVYNNLGSAFMQKNDYIKAIYWYEKAIEINPNWEIAKANLARAKQKVAIK